MDSQITPLYDDPGIPLGNTFFLKTSPTAPFRSNTCSTTFAFSLAAIPEGAVRARRHLSAAEASGASVGARQAAPRQHGLVGGERDEKSKGYDPHHHEEEPEEVLTE